jgi:lipoate-protein ligase A
MHSILAQALAEFDVHAELARAAAADVVIGGHKVAGSSQRRRRGALLQHGGVLLSQSEHTPQLPGIRELAGRVPDVAEFSDVLARVWARESGWAVAPSSWGRWELERRGSLVAEKYLRPDWNEKR